MEKSAMLSKKVSLDQMPNFRTYPHIPLIQVYQRKFFYMVHFETARICLFRLGYRSFVPLVIILLFSLPRS